MDEYAQLIETTDRRPHSFPEGKQQTDLRERLFSARQSFGAAAGAVVFRDIGLDLERYEGSVNVVKL